MKNSLAGGTILFTAFFGLTGCTKPPEKTSPAVSALAVNTAINTADMLNGVHYPGLSSYYTLMKEEKFREARNVVIVKFGANTPTLQSLVADAEIKEYLQAINDPKAPKEEKQAAIVGISISYPDHAKPYANLVEQAKADLAKTEKRKVAAAERIAAADRRKDAAEAKKRGVSVGMTQDEVVGSNWGRPSQKNRTITRHGIHEQWVYSGGYLYFEDGILRAIQN